MSSAYWYCPSAYIRKSRFLIVERQLGYDERGRTSGRALERVIYKFLADELLRDDSPFPAEHILCARDLGREAAISAGVFLLADYRAAIVAVFYSFHNYDHDFALAKSTSPKRSILSCVDVCGGYAVSF